jgi:hypothetical protein
MSKTTKEPLRRVNHKGEHQVPKPSPVVRSMLNKERGEPPPERTLNLKKPSPTHREAYYIRKREDLVKGHLA